MNILSDLWEEVEHADSFNKPSGYRIRKYLNKDRLQGIIVNDDSKKYWLESMEEIPKYVRAYIKKFCKNRGYTYLYD